MTAVIFKSVLKDELASFIEFVKLSVVDYKAFQHTLLELDSFFYKEGLAEKKLDTEQLSRWLDGFNVSSSTKKGKLSHVNKFARYLSTFGIKTSIPELPRVTSDFTPYVFTTDEMAQIFEIADDYMLVEPTSRIIAEFPMLLRILYGCGLRLGEAISLTWDEVDLSTGVITIKVAKNQKQRIAPMGDELTRILKLYRAAPCFIMEEHGLLFKTDDGQPRTSGTYWRIFDSILCEIGIKNPQTVKHGARGPCIHSLRHTFTMNSFLKAEAEGRGFMETVPFLSTYLGHAGLMQTDVYLKARYELYTQAHSTIADYTNDVFPEDVWDDQ